MTTTQQSEYAALVLRLSLGIMYLAHGLLKLIVFTPAGTAGFFDSVGLPGWLAHPTIFAETIGGTMLIAGIYSRYVSLALIPALIGSIIFVHLSAGWLFSNQGGGYEYPLFLIAASVAQAFLGDGAYSVKQLFRPKAVAAGA